MAKMKIKTGDTVQVLSGKDKGKRGVVVRALPREGMSSSRVSPSPRRPCAPRRTTSRVAS